MALRQRAFGLVAREFGGEEDSGRGLNPLAVIRTSGRVFWLMDQAFYESSRMLVVEVTASSRRVALVTGGGGC
jgi:hypothetical protein